MSLNVHGIMVPLVQLI